MLSFAPLQTLFDTTVTKVRDESPVPVSMFYLRRPYFVPWSSNPTTFILSTDEPGSLHTIVLNRTDIISTIPGSPQLSMQFSLLKGPNRFEISTPTQNVTVTIAATAIEAWMYGVGREIYLDGQRRLDEIQSQFDSPWTTRLSAHLYPFGDLFLAETMPRLQQTRFAIATMFSGRAGFGDGVKRIATAISYSTPYVTRARDSEFNLPGKFISYPGVTTYPTLTEMSGRVFDLWYPNVCLAAKLALTQLIEAVGARHVTSPKPLELVDVSDVQVLLRTNGGPIEAQYMDPQAVGCSNVVQSDGLCHINERVFVEFDGVRDIMMQMPQLSFDEGVENPLNFGFWDMGYTLDGSVTGDPGLGGEGSFDVVDPDDVFGDGFLGVFLTNRFDSGGCLDTRFQKPQRLAKYLLPLTGTTEDTPDDPAGTPLVVDSATGAPPATVGTTNLWGVSPRIFLMPGDYIRTEAPDADLQVVSAVPILSDVTQIQKSSDLATYVVVGTQRTIVVPTLKFFTFSAIGQGLQALGSASIDGLFSIAAVSMDGTTATVTGRNTALVSDPGPFHVDLFRPLLDRKDTTFVPLTGRRTFNVTLASPLLATVPDITTLDYREVPRVVGAALMGASSLFIASDIEPLPQDLLYLTPTTSVVVSYNLDTGNVHHTSGRKIFQVFLDSTTPLPSALTDDQTLYAVHAAPCQPGTPVTILSMIYMENPTYITV